MSINKFIINVAAEMMRASNKNYTDNYDELRFGREQEEIKTKKSFKNQFISFINSKGYYNDFKNDIYSKQIENIDYPLHDFIYLYDLLEDEYSKKLLVKIIVYRILGYKKVKLPLNTPAYWSNIKLIESHQSKNDFIDIQFMNTRIPLTNLQFLGVPIKMYYSALGINIDFIIKQYELKRGAISIEANIGDVVIDAGGCFGDTALYFANKVSSNGKVHVFEFINDNIKILEKNISLNPSLKDVISLAAYPVWSVSNQDVFFVSNGPGSKVSMQEFEGYTNKTKTICIDDYCTTNNIEKIDFVKMDIEGAELNALQGAIRIIKKCKPKLAIALYHSTNDFDVIPRFLNDLKLGYKFYLSHSTIYAEETMLFAVAEIKG